MAKDLIQKQEQLEALRAQIIADHICPELEKTATQLVFGHGSPDAKIVFIGEAPGKKEDLKGVPFIGAAGKFLDEMLATISTSRQDVYITNIVKYRPPNNRDPLPAEKAAFMPYLQAQLEIIQPKIVVTLGRHSLNCFLPDLQISKVHGQPQQINLAVQPTGAKALKVVLLPLFHPAAALYNGGLRQTLIDDFARIPDAITHIEKEHKNNKKRK